MRRDLEQNVLFNFIANLLSPVENQVIDELTIEQYHRLPQFVKRHKLSVPFYTKLLKSDIKVPEKVGVELKLLALNKSTQMLNLTSELIRLQSLFSASAIDFISLKGPALALMLYNDLSGKQSGDLDILVSVDDVWIASKVLIDNGYEREYLPKTINESQANYVLQSYHHLGFIHTEKRYFVELHWRLNTNKYAEPFRFNEILDKAVDIKVGNISVKAMCPQQALAHQLIHGSGHAWFALAWLRDTVTLAIRNDVNLDALWIWAKQNKYERMVAQGLLLGERVFGSFLQPSLRLAMTNTISLKLVDFAYQILISNEVPLFLVAPQVGRIKQKIYLSKLKSDWKYKKQVWSVVGTNPRDWEILKLPNRLFFLYIVLRPVLYFYTVYFKKKSR
jgi:hypothetical protein